MILWMINPLTLGEALRWLFCPGSLKRKAARQLPAPRPSIETDGNGRMIALAQDAANDIAAPADMKGEWPAQGHGIPEDAVHQATVACVGYLFMFGTVTVALILQACR